MGTTFEKNLTPGEVYITQEYEGTDKNDFKAWNGWRFSYTCTVKSDYWTTINWQLGPTGAEQMASNTRKEGGAKIYINGSSTPAQTQNWATLYYKPSTDTAYPSGYDLLSGSFDIEHNRTTGHASFTIKLETGTYWKPKAWGGGHDKLFTSNLTCSVPQNPAGWACTSPTCTVDGYINGANKQVSLTWSGAQDGGINKVAGYNIYYTTDNTTPTASSLKISFASTDKSGSKTITLNSIPSRGGQVKFAIQAYGTDPDRTSGINQSSNSSYVNRLPSKPTCSYYLYSDQNCTTLVPSSQDTIFPSSGAYVKFSVTAGSDSDSGQTRTVWYSIGNGTKQQYNSSTGLVYTLSANTTINFYTYDGYEYSSTAQSFTFTKNTLPTLSNSTYTASSLSPESSGTNPYVVTLKASASGLSHRISVSKFNVYFQYSTTTSGPWTKTTDPIIFSGLSKAEFTIPDVRARIPLRASGVLYYKVYVQQDDGIETLKEVQVGGTYKLNAIPTGDGFNKADYTNASGLSNYISSVFSYKLKATDKGYTHMYLRIVDSGLREFKTNKVAITNNIQASFESISSPTLSGESLTIYPVLCTNTFEQELAGMEYLTISPIISTNTSLTTDYSTTPYCPFTFDTTAKTISFALAQFMLTTEKDDGGVLKIGKHGITSTTTFKLNFTAGNLSFTYDKFKVVDGASGQYSIEIADTDLWSKLSNKTSYTNYEDSITLSYTDSFGATYTTKPGALKVTYQGPMEVTSFQLYYKNSSGTITALTNTVKLKENMEIYLGATVKGFSPTPAFKITQKIGEKEITLKELAGTSFITTSTSTHRVGYTQYTYTIKDSTYSYTKIATLGENIEGGLDGIGIMTSFSLLPKNSAYQDYSSVYAKNSTQYQYIRHTTGTISLSDCEYTEPVMNNQTRYVVSVNFTISDFGVSTSLTNEYIAELYMSPQNSDNYQTTGKTITLSASSTSGQFILDNAFTGAQKIRILVKVTNKNNGINSTKQFYSNFLTIFNTSSFPPTVSYRKNYLGFNIADPESDSYKDCILVFGEAVNPNNGNEITRNRIIFVGTKEDYCVAENFRFDGGSWDP